MLSIHPSDRATIVWKGERRGQETFTWIKKSPLPGFGYCGIYFSRSSFRYVSPFPKRGTHSQLVIFR